MFNCGYQIISTKLFNHYDFFDFYRESKEFITPNMYEIKWRKVPILFLLMLTFQGKSLSGAVRRVY